MRDVKDLRGEIEMTGEQMEIAKELFYYIQNELGRLKGIEITDDFIETEVIYGRLFVMKKYNEIWFVDDGTIKDCSINLETKEIRLI